MNGKRASLGWKAAAVLLFLAASASAAIFIGAALLMYSAGCGQGGDYFDSNLCHIQIQNYRGNVVSSLLLGRVLERDDLSYLERQQSERSLAELEEKLSPENTSFRYQLKSYDGTQVLQTNLLPGETLEQATRYQWYYTIRIDPDRDQIVYSDNSLRGDGGAVIFYITEPDPERPAASLEEELELFQRAYEDTLGEGMPNELYDAVWNSLTSRAAEETEPSADQELLVLECGLPEKLDGHDDAFYQESIDFYYSQGRFPLMLAGAAGSLLVMLICLVFLCLGAGHRKGVEGIYLNIQDRIWYDVYLALAVGAGTFIFVLMDSFMWNVRDVWTIVLLIAGSIVMPMAGLVLAVILTTAARCKAGTLLRHTLIASCIRGAVRFVRALPLTWRVVTASFLFALMTIVFVASWRYHAVLPLLAAEGCVMLYLCTWSAGFGRLRRAGAALASGDLDYRVDTAHMLHDLRCHGEDLNNISGGMASAVQERMKSERFKAELITNVSHDLKTPLTSIINYVDLLKKADVQDEKAQEYIRVLDAKSQRLKKLTEDLVEASKASTGTLTVERERLGMAQLVGQALGEYGEKLEEKHLQLVTALPEGELYVYADGRHLWRVLDNLLSNCCKYAMEGTRVYLELARKHGQVVFSLKNISRDALNVPAEQLMERFVRGDKSRTTEGSGLGLSIARSLTELQGGAFELEVDGDLFKATVSLPQMS